MGEAQITRQIDRSTDQSNLHPFSSLFFFLLSHHHPPTVHNMRSFLLLISVALIAFPSALSAPSPPPTRQRIQAACLGALAVSGSAAAVTATTSTADAAMTGTRDDTLSRRILADPAFAERVCQDVWNQYGKQNDADDEPILDEDQLDSAFNDEAPVEKEDQWLDLTLLPNRQGLKHRRNRRLDMNRFPTDIPNDDDEEPKRRQMNEDAYIPPSHVIMDERSNADFRQALADLTIADPRAAFELMRDDRGCCHHQGECEGSSCSWFGQSCCFSTMDVHQGGCCCTDTMACRCCSSYAAWQCHGCHATCKCDT
jgi:hypothetical protein